MKTKNSPTRPAETPNSMQKPKTLEKKLAKLLPKVDPRAQFAWTASFGQSKTGLPSIGPIPGYSRCYCVLGYGGNGITFSMLATTRLRLN